MTSKYSGSLFATTQTKPNEKEKNNKTVNIELQAKLLIEKYNKVCFDATDLKEILGVGETNIYQLLKSEKLNVIKIGNRKVVPVVSLAEFMIYRNNL